MSDCCIHFYLNINCVAGLPIAGNLALMVIILIENLSLVRSSSDVKMWNLFNLHLFEHLVPANVSLFKFNNRDTRKSCEIYSYTVKNHIDTAATLLTDSAIVIVNFEHISQIFLVFLLLILNK